MLELLFKAALVQPVYLIGSRPLLQLGTCLLKNQFKFHQTMMTSLLVPSSSVRGQKFLDYEAFNVKLVNVPSLLLHHRTFCEFKEKIKKLMLKLPKFKSVQTLDIKKGKCVVYLDPRKIKDISEEFKKEISWEQIYEEKDLQLSYENWSCNEVLRAILPEEIEVPTSYSIIGHIIHMNLRKEQLPYKEIIGQVYLDKSPNIKTVVNKLDIIDNTYRNFSMETLAGEENTIVSVKENGITYEFDFAKVYWNPRLCTEHRTLVEYLQADDVLYDVFCGVGPFSIPAARKGVRVLANDLNPESYKWLLRNAEINKVKKRLSAFNKDGRDFIKNEVKIDILNRREKNVSGSEHIVMNLPAMAVEFLDIFSNWFNVDEIEKVTSKLPKIHVYCFIKVAKNEDFNALAKELVEDKLGAKLEKDALINIHHVRNVAPNKEMMRIKMGKNKSKGKNVFKVSNSRCQKAKAKAKKVKSSLKKLDLGQGSKLNKEKTNLINKQLAEISKEVYQSAGKKKSAAKKVAPIKPVQPVSQASKEQATNLIQNIKL